MALPLLLPLLSLPLNDGGGLSSFDFRFSARRAAKRIYKCHEYHQNRVQRTGSFAPLSESKLHLPFAGRKLSGGDADSVLLLFVELMPEFDAVIVVVVLVVLVVALVDVRAARPFALAFRSLL